ncbi:hypothetical protein IIB51_00720 [Patescibacteria group bacterium]|nr:hypothetical protein [Patescibacteria group bacterium]
MSELITEFLALFQTPAFLFSFQIFKWASPVWLPIVLFVVLGRLWMRYIQMRTIENTEHVLLEIRLPAEIKKTPLAMEAVLASFQMQHGETTWIKRRILGTMRPWFSLELVSIEGKVHFFIWTRKNLKNVVEAAIYSQYPDVEIVESEDYSLYANFEKGKTSAWGCDFKLTKQDAYPIKTYIDYGLDKETTKEEQKVDPLSGLLEFLSSMGPGEQLWYQILIRQTRKERKKPGTLFGKRDWREEAEELVKKLQDEAKPSMEAGDAFEGFVQLTPGQAETIKSIERSITKLGFDCGIRGIYIAKNDAFVGPKIPAFIYSLRQFNSNTLNGFAITRWLAKFDYPWQDYKDIRQDRTRRRLLDAYRRRSWFYPPYKTPSYVLNTEELATIFHFPGGTAQAPGVTRIASRRAEAPRNIPQ